MSYFVIERGIMEQIDFNKIKVEQIKLNCNDEQARKVYKNSFPVNERVPFKSLFEGVFKDFTLYGFYIDDVLTGFIHLLNAEDFVHLNYLAVAEGYRDKGIGSYIISWIKNKFDNKPLVADVENVDFGAENNSQRLQRLKFYYKNGFTDGVTEFDWEGTSMYYIHTNTISDEKFMEHIQICFPTIKNLRPHKSNALEVQKYINNSCKIVD